MAWAQLDLEHIAYACVGIFCTLFSLVSLFVKEQLYIGEATVATIAGLILGPHCLNWFDPIHWGNHDRITLEISRIVLCIQIVAVAVELPKKYMKKHWLSVAIFLLPVMTCGWLIVGLFIWVLMPHLTFPESLLVSACITATDPVLAAAVVGKGKFAERVPGHLRNLLSAESGCNDGMAFPFIYLSLNLIIHHGDAREIVKDWFLLTILWECLFGIVLGTFLGYTTRKLIAFAESHNLIDRESFLAIFIFIAFNSAGIGSMLGVDDLLVSFAAGTAFGWNGDFAKKTEESHVSTVIDLILNLAYFVFFGAIVPWEQFNQADIGLNVWRLVVLAFVIIFLRRLPAVVALKPFTPDVKTWREAFFCGHFGPIGVGAIFAVILARTDLEAHYTTEETPLRQLPNTDFPHYELLAGMWPIVTFIVITSIIVHGSSVAVLTLGKRLNRMAITMTLTTNTTENGNNWLSRLQNLDRTATSFSLHRIDSEGNTLKDEKDNDLSRASTVETSGIKVRPAGGAKRKKHRHRKRKGARSNIIKTFSRDEPPTEEARYIPQQEFLQLGRTPAAEDESTKDFNDSSPTGSPSSQEDTVAVQEPKEEFAKQLSRGSLPTTAYQEGNKIIIEDEHGEIVETVLVGKGSQTKPSQDVDDLSLHSMASLRRHLTEFSHGSSDNNDSTTIDDQISKMAQKKQLYYKKNDPRQTKVFAHQIDNIIVIENEDGEVVRRYKVNRHSSQRPRSDSLLDKALSMVGIKNKDKVQDLEEHQTSVLVPDYTNKNTQSPLDDPKVERSVEKKLTRSILGTDARNAAIPVPPLVEEEEESENPDNSGSDSEQSLNSEEDDDDDDDDLLHETEIEKQRRLAALGQLPATRRDDDEEE